ncbi:MAG: helix-turn-helix domain-containing protein [Chitinivibrionales bacterium]|nr:helix-turn-helix domain-containing protein [Chitinivibrionales bacterium]
MGMTKRSQKQPLRSQWSRLHALGVDLRYYPSYRRTDPWMHTLDVVLLSFIVRGRGRHIMENDVYEEHGCSLGITHYGQQHSIITDSDGMDIMNIFLDPQNHPLPELPGELRDILPELIPLHPGFQHRLNRIVRLQFDDPEPVTRLVFAMHDEIEGGRPGYAEAVRHYLTLFLMHCCRHVLAQGLVPSVPRRREGAPVLEELRRYLDRTYTEQHSLAALAERAGLSRTYLCRAFKRYTGKSVFEYLLDRRIQAAMVRLRGGNEKVLAVALECGFGDAAFFNRAFRARVGMTPTAYRTSISDRMNSVSGPGETR